MLATHLMHSLEVAWDSWNTSQGLITRGQSTAPLSYEHGLRKPDVTHSTNNWFRNKCADRLRSNPLEFLIKLQGQPLDVRLVGLTVFLAAICVTR